MTFPSFVDGRACRTLNVVNRGLAYGHGLFETMRLAGGTLPLWNYHRARLLASVPRLGLQLDMAGLERELEHGLDTWPADGVVKLIVTAGKSPRGYAYQADTEPCRILQYFPPRLSQPGGSDGVGLRVCKYRLPCNPALAGLKHLNRLDQVLAAAELPEGCEGLLLDAEGRVAESLHGNLFFRRGQQWCTPDLSTCGVTGVMRSLLLAEVLPALDVIPLIDKFEIRLLREASEVFVCNAVSGVTPIATLDGQVLGGQAQGHTEAGMVKIQRELHRRYPCFGL